MPEKFTTYYKSVIVFGSVRILGEREEMAAAARELGRRYCPHEAPQALEAEIAGALGRMYMLEMTVEHMTGKAARELTETPNP